MHRPTSTQWMAMKRLLWYLVGTLHHALFLHKDSPLRLHAYSNVDWASNPNDRSSTSAHVVFLGPNVISCSSKKQKFIARFSTKAEYRVVSSTTVEVLWIKSLLLELSIDVRSALPTYYDNVGVTYLCDNPIFHLCMKHIAFNFHFVRHKVQDGELHVSYFFR